MVSTLLSVPEPLDDWLPDVGPLEELEPGWDLGWDRDWVDWVDWVDWAWDGDRVDWVDWAWDGDWVDWGWSPSLGASSDISPPVQTVSSGSLQVNTPDCSGGPGHVGTVCFSFFFTGTVR